jgi:type II secretory pathway component PulM
MMKAITPSIQAYGVKGMKSTPWQKTFKSVEALNAWVEKNGAEVHGIREINPDEVTFR